MEEARGHIIDEIHHGEEEKEQEVPQVSLVDGSQTQVQPSDEMTDDTSTSPVNVPTDTTVIRPDNPIDENQDVING